MRMHVLLSDAAAVLTQAGRQIRTTVGSTNTSNCPSHNRNAQDINAATQQT